MFDAGLFRLGGGRLKVFERLPCLLADAVRYLPHVHADFGERGLHRLRGFGGGLLCRADGGLCRLLCLYGPGGGIDGGLCGGLCGGLIGGAGFGLKPREALRLGLRAI